MTRRSQLVGMVLFGMAEARRRGNGAQKSGSGSRSKSGNARSGSTSSKSGSSSSKSGSSSSKSRSKSGSEEHVRGTAPSAADITKLEKFEASEEAKQHEPSDVDARGQDKRRQVVGHSYGPSARTKVVFFVGLAVVLVVLVGGWLGLVALFDKPPTNFTDHAPWSTTVTNAELAAEQNAKPRSPADPCGEPGGEYPIPPTSPYAPPNKANDFQGSPK